MTLHRPVGIGMIVPSSNTAFEDGTRLLLAGRDDVSLHVHRVRVTEISLTESASSRFDPGVMAEAASLLADARPDALAWAGTAGSWLGLAHDRRIVAAVSDVTGLPATTSTLALLAACERLGADRVGLVTPYVPEVVRRIESVYERAGVCVVAEEHLSITDNYAFGTVPANRIATMVRACATGGADAVLVVCTNLRATGLAPSLEAALGIPVLDSIAVTVDETTSLGRMAGADAAGTGAGTGGQQTGGPCDS